MIGRRTICRAIGPFRRDSRGLALVEFAVALPVMLLLYLGGWQLSDAIACNRKVTITAHAVADLTSQYASLPQASVDSIIAAATKIMTPYDASNAGIIVSEFCTDNNGNTSIPWSEASANTSKRTVLPSTISTMVSNNTCLIYGEVHYKYTPIVLYGFTGPITLSQAIYMSPRISPSVSMT
jgi:Flp pilus assembly protein TadG